MRKYFAGLSKRQMFIGILLALGVLSLIASLFTRITFLTEKETDFLRVAVAGPMSGPSDAIGRSMAEGARLYVEQLNAEGGIDGVKFALDVLDDRNDPGAAVTVAKEVAAKGLDLAVIGHWSGAATADAGEVYKNGRIPAIVPGSVDVDAIKNNPWYFSALFDKQQEARFLANYSRNVLGHRLVSMIVDKQAFGATMANDFEATYKRFGTAVRYTWTFDGTAASAETQMRLIVDELKEKKDAGVLFLAVDENAGARLIKMMREAGVRNMVIGSNTLATHAFMQRLTGLLGGREDPALYTNGILASSPLLFDTANETAQNFRNGYQARFGYAPDWVAAYAYDSMNVIAQAVRDLVKRKALKDPVANRAAIREFLAARGRPDRGIDGLSGPTYFNEGGVAQKPVLVGIYNGKNIISALTQLQPIKIGNTANYIEELKQGRVLYVNDRFMYKTNVVYTGLQVKDVSEIKLESNSAVLDILIWFRYRGDFRPQDLTFTNALDPIALTEPIDEKEVGDMRYRAYSVKGRFALDFTDTNRKYGSHIVGVSFSHRELNRNNLLYVVDVLGIGLDSGKTVLDKVREARALNPALGWELDRAWISQDVVEKGTVGNPTYVGFGAADPDFSKVDYGIMFKPAAFNARDFIPSEYFVYLGIFGFFGILFAILMDQKEKGRFWKVQSWGLRVVSWPLFLLAAGNIVLDIAFINLSTYYIDMVVMVYNILWWMMPARLLGIAAERFLWQPLEDHTERTIPNVVRVFASVAIYSFSSFGVIAFVFDQQLTSLLASTGLLAMIIGLAIQANISNIFSGIVINMERPFNVGDWIQIGDMDEGRVVDITWRTTRVKVRNGYVISLPNGKVSEERIRNFDSFDVVRLELPVYLDARHPPEEVQMIMMTALETAENVLDQPEREVRFKGIEWKVGWVALYEVQFWIDNYGRREEIAEGVLSHVYAALRRAGMSPQSSERGRRRLADEAGLAGEHAEATEVIEDADDGTEIGEEGAEAAAE